MAQQRKDLTFTFVNPNTPEAFEKLLQKILLEKLISALHQKGAGNL